MQDLVEVKCKFSVDKCSEAAFVTDYYGQTGRRSACAAKGSKEYGYKALASLGLKKGDFVCVSTPSYGLTVVQICEDPVPLTYDRPNYLKWVVDKVDVEGHNQRKRDEAEKERIRATLAKMVQEARAKIEIAEVLKDDPAAQELLQRLKELG